MGKHGTRIESSSSSENESLSEDDAEAWDEYENVVLGDYDDESDDKDGGMTAEDKKLAKEVSEYFAKADADANGALSMLEFFEFARQQRGKSTNTPKSEGVSTESSGELQAVLRRIEDRLSSVEE